MRYSVRNFTLFSLINIAIKHIIVLILAALVAATAAFSYCKYIATPSFSATGYIVVTNGSIISTDDIKNNEIISSADISSSSSLLNVVVDLLNTNGMYKKLSAELDGKYSFQNLMGRSTIERKENSYIQIKVSFTASTQKEAVYLVNSYLEVAPEYIDSYIKSATTSIIESDNAHKTYPQTMTSTMLSAVAGAVLTYCIILIIYSANVIIQDEEDFKQRFDVPIIGCVPDFTQARSNKYYYNRYYKRSGYYGYKK